jgi:hypothetical protein
MAAYEWSRGGEWGGKPWSAELPTDSALLFYIFADYLAAPQWLFPQVGWWVDPARWAGVLPMALRRPGAAAACPPGRMPDVPHPCCACCAVLQDDPAVISGLSGTLYLGKLPTKPADGYVGVLAARPPTTPKVGAVNWCGECMGAVKHWRMAGQAGSCCCTALAARSPAEACPSQSAISLTLH